MARAPRELRQEHLHRAPRQAPVRRPAPLRVLQSPRPARRSLGRLGTTVAIVMLFLAAFAAAAAHALVAQNQFRLNALSSQLDAASAQNKVLQLKVAELESPQRVVAVAEHRLGLVLPTSVTYVQAVAPPKGRAGSGGA